MNLYSWHIFPACYKNCRWFWPLSFFLSFDECIIKPFVKSTFWSCGCFVLSNHCIDWFFFYIASLSWEISICNDWFWYCKCFVHPFYWLMFLSYYDLCWDSMRALNRWVPAVFTVVFISHPINQWQTNVQTLSNHSPVVRVKGVVHGWRVGLNVESHFHSSPFTLPYSH